MFNTNDKISARDFERAIESCKKRDGELEWNGLKIKLRSIIDLEDMIMFVKYVVDSCFDAETGEYLPEIKSFALNSAILMFYTNIELPDDAKSQCGLLYGTDLFEHIFDSDIIDQEQLHSMVEAIDKKIDYLSASDAQRLPREFEDTANALTELLEHVEEIFGGINNADVAETIAGLSKGELDEEIIARDILNGRYRNK